MREAGDTGMYFGASSGRYHLVSQVKCRNCSEELYADQHYTKTLYEMALEGARRIWAIKIALPISALLFAALVAAGYMTVVTIARYEDSELSKRYGAELAEEVAKAEENLAKAKDL